MTFKISVDDWFKPKSYIHFDCPIAPSDKERVESFVSDPEKVSVHSFYPFITYEVTKYKMTEDDDGIRYLDDKGIRPLSYAAHLDSQIYSFYAKGLSAFYEQSLKNNGIHDNVLAFRKLSDAKGRPKCNIHLANEAFENIKLIGNCSVFAFDIKSFFDKLDHLYLKRSWAKLLGCSRLPKDHFTIYKSLTSHSIVFRKDLYKEFSIPKKNPKAKGYFRICEPSDFRARVRSKGLIQTKNIGIPQGSPISAFLANVYMLEFDKVLNNKLKSLGGVYYRYCDDILCIIPEDRAYDIEPYVKNELKNVELPLNTDKTEKRKFSYDGKSLICDKPIQYLGFMFDGERKYIRAASISRYRRKARKAVRLAKATMRKKNKVRESKGLPIKKLYKKKIYKKYFHTGKTNFLTYGYRASEIMASNEIRQQMKKLNKFLVSEIASDDR